MFYAQPFPAQVVINECDSDTDWTGDGVTAVDTNDYFEATGSIAMTVAVPVILILRKTMPPDSMTRAFTWLTLHTTVSLRMRAIRVNMVFT